MSKFELSISPNYVLDWTIDDAIRELFQNAIDQEVSCEDNKMYFNYDKQKQTICISNKNSILEVSSLLMGESTKADKENLIGKFGEGYKIATLVLLRNNKQITFYNYGKKEVWRPRFINSRRFGGVKILTFDIDKNYFWKKTPDNNLTIIIENISEDEFNITKDKNLHLQSLTEDDFKDVTHGRILLNDKHKGVFFINGLFVYKNQSFQYGYDILPEYLNLDRDRKLVKEFDLQWLTSIIWSNSTDAELLHNMLIANFHDVRFVGSLLHNLNINVQNKIHDDFKKEHGDNAVPVSNQDDASSLSDQYKPIIVNDSYKNIITTSNNYKKPTESMSVKELLIDWIERNKNALTESECIEFLEIIEKL